MTSETAAVCDRQRARDPVSEIPEENSGLPDTRSHDGASGGTQSTMFHARRFCDPPVSNERPFVGFIPIMRQLARSRHAGLTDS
jgi:hypothetical protein